MNKESLHNCCLQLVMMRHARESPPGAVDSRSRGSSLALGGAGAPGASLARAGMAGDANGAETYTTDEALSRLGFGRFQALLLGFLGTGWVAEAMEVMLLSFVGPSVKEEWRVSGGAEGLISSVAFTGMLLGACVGGLGSDRYGRRYVLPFFRLQFISSAVLQNSFEAIVIQEIGRKGFAIHAIDSFQSRFYDPWTCGRRNNQTIAGPTTLPSGVVVITRCRPFSMFSFLSQGWFSIHCNRQWRTWFNVRVLT
jgi:hypothetical protein